MTFENIKKIYDIEINFEKYHMVFKLKKESKDIKFNNYILIFKEHYDEFQKMISWYHETYGIETWELITQNQVKDNGIIAEFYEKDFWADSKNILKMFFKTKKFRQIILKKSLNNE
jgi:hypothetical protein